MTTRRTSGQFAKRYQVWIVATLTAIVIVFAMNLVFDRDLKSTTNGGSGISRSICAGNTRDICIAAPSVDLYPAGTQNGVNVGLRTSKDDTQKSIGGVVTGLSKNEMRLRTSSGRNILVTFPIHIQSWWNQNIGIQHNSYRLGIGDTVRIDYVEPANEHSNRINADQIAFSVLAIDPSVPMSEPIRRYPNGQ